MAQHPRHKGRTSYLALGLSGGALTVLSGARGLDGFEQSEPEDTREIPGGDQVRSQRLGYRKGTSSFAIDDNETTRSILWGTTGLSAKVVYGPQGNASGLPRVTSSAFLEVSHTFEARGVRRFSVTLQHSGESKYDVFP